MQYLCKTNKELIKMEKQKFEKPTTNNPGLVLRIYDNRNKNAIGETTNSLYLQELEELSHKI